MWIALWCRLSGLLRRLPYLNERPLEEIDSLVGLRQQRSLALDFFRQRHDVLLKFTNGVAGIAAMSLGVRLRERPAQECVVRAAKLMVSNTAAAEDDRRVAVGAAGHLPTASVSGSRKPAMEIAEPTVPAHSIPPHATGRPPPAWW